MIQGIETYWHYFTRLWHQLLLMRSDMIRDTLMVFDKTMRPIDEIWQDKRHTDEIWQNKKHTDEIWQNNETYCWDFTRQESLMRFYKDPLMTIKCLINRDFCNFQLLKNVTYLTMYVHMCNIYDIVNRQLLLFINK